MSEHMGHDSGDGYALEKYGSKKSVGKQMGIWESEAFERFLSCSEIVQMLEIQMLTLVWQLKSY